MQFKYIAAALVSFAVGGAMAAPAPDVDMLNNAIQARAEQAEQAQQAQQAQQGQQGQQGKQFFPGAGVGLGGLGVGGLGVGGLGLNGLGFNPGFNPGFQNQALNWNQQQQQSSSQNFNWQNQQFGGNPLFNGGIGGGAQSCFACGGQGLGVCTIGWAAGQPCF